MYSLTSCALTLASIFQILPNGPNSIGVAPRATSQKTDNHVGAIVGGTIGGVALLAIIAFGTFFLIHRQRKARVVNAATYDDKDDPAKPVAIGTIQPFDIHSPTSQTLPSVPPSTVGSSALTPTSTTGLFPERSAVIAFNPDDEHHASLEVAPPSYEASAGMQSPTLPPTPQHEHEKSAGSISSISSMYADPQVPRPLPPIAESSSAHALAGSEVAFEEQ